MKNNITRPRVWLAHVLVLLAGCLGVCLACDLNVRETGFLNNAGGPYFPMQYKLVLVATNETPAIKELVARMQKLEAGDLAGCNLSVTVLAADKLSAKERELMKQDGIPADKLPLSCLLVQSQFERNVVFTENRLFTEEDVRALALSPAKLKLQGLLSENGNYCVFVLVAGADKKSAAQAEKEIDAAIKACSARLEKQKIKLLKIDRSAPAEKLFLRELGIEAGNETVCAAVFGKGRVAVPILKGIEITTDRASEQFAFLQANASDCTPDAVYLPGSVIDMILPWTDKMDAKMYMDIAKSGVVPDLAWTEAEVDPNTGELIDKPVK
jgi:hypothetical protein